MARDYLVLDIETIPDLDLYTPPEMAAGFERPFPPSYAHQIVVIGLLWLDESYAVKRLGICGEGKDEAGMLADFAAFVERERPHLVTYNGRCFDLPVIALRSLRHGLTMRFYYEDPAYRHRYAEGGHLDLCDVLSQHGAARSLSLDAIARLTGLPGKIGVDGSQVEGMVRAGHIEEVRNYCLSDVVQTAFLLYRFRLLQGQIDQPTYRQAARALLDAVEGDGRFALLTANIERPRLLLAG